MEGKKTNIYIYNWASAVDKTLAWDNCTPLAIPVVPEEHTIRAIVPSLLTDWNFNFALAGKRFFCISILYGRIFVLLSKLSNPIIWIWCKLLWLLFTTAAIKSIDAFEANITFGLDRLIACSISPT